MTEVDELRARLREKEAETEDLKKRLQPRRSLNIKMPSYNGGTDFEEYLTQFISICEFQDWNDDEAAILLLSKLEGNALSVAAALDDQSLRSLVFHLRRQFSQDQEEVATLKLYGRNQKSDETFENLSLDIKRLTKKAYAGTDDRTRDRLARDAFVNAVADESIREKLRDRNPGSLADAVREAICFAANKELEKGRMKVVTPKSKSEKSELQQLKEQVRQLEIGAEQPAKPQKKPGQNFKRKDRGQPSGSQSRSKTPRDPPSCWRCAQKGHLSRWCPFSDEQIEELKRSGK